MRVPATSCLTRQRHCRTRTSEQPLAGATRQKTPTALPNNIPSYATDRTGLCTGTLIFGVGLRNDPATLAGITHLVEHVVLYMVEHLPLLLGGRRVDE